MDVAILGGGIVGLTLANLLSQNPQLSIALIEPTKPQLDWDQNQYDLRCSAITPAAQNIFELLSVWRDITLHRVGSYNKMLVWDQELHNKIEFDAQSIKATHLGHIIENRVIAKVLYEKLLQANNVVIMHAAATDLQQNVDSNIISVDSKQIECQLVVGADGSNSWLRKKANIANYGWDYQHVALVAVIETQHGHNNVAMQRFTADGPLAFLPLDRANLCSIVWSGPPAKIQELVQCDPQDFCVQLAQAFCYQLGTLKLVSGRASFPLRMLHAMNYVLPRLALVGDAAHVIHPLAGQGLNLGILDAVQLNHVLQQAWQCGKDIGDLKVLRKYERARKAHNIPMIALMEGFKRGFAAQGSLLTRMRAQALHLADNLDFAKNAMIRLACHQKF